MTNETGASMWGIGKRKIAKRESLSEEEIYDLFYLSSGLSAASVLEIWHEIASTLRIPPGKLRPSDKFGVDVGAFWITSERLDELYLKAGARARLLALDVDFQEIKGVDAYVRRFATRSSAGSRQADQTA